jgi:hypothetical protein
VIPKKRSRRSSSKYPALDPQLNLKTRFEELDFDYVNTLPDVWVDPKTGKKYNPKQFLNDFANESIHADFKTNKKRIHKKKKVESKNNKHLQSISKKLNKDFKEIIVLLNETELNLVFQLNEKFKKYGLSIKNSQISTTSKMKLDNVLNKLKNKFKQQIKDSFKIQFKEIQVELKNKFKQQIKESMSFVEDFYKKEAEDKNNSRNRCILTRAKAQGKALGIDDLSELLMVSNDLEDEIIEKIDRERELDFLEKLQDPSDSSDET